MGLISTIKASCRDCYKCVRHCPVKAIRVTGDHAEVVQERCLADGRCIAICPQKAKKIESSVNKVKNLLYSGSPVAVSLAPSFVVAFEAGPRQIVAALKQLGFRYVEETAEGAELVAQEHLKVVERSAEAVITSCCPAIVNLLEIYYPQLLPYLAPVVSPMVAHGRILRERYGSDCKVVFIGPCIAKKGETEPHDIDAVLTFAELTELFDERGIDPKNLDGVGFDGLGSQKARAFATPGGLAKSAPMDTDILAQEVISIDGLDESISGI